MRLVTVVLSILVSFFLFSTVHAADPEKDDCQFLRPLAGDVDEKMFALISDISNQCLKKGQREVKLHISTPGGDAGYANGIFGIVRNAENFQAVTTIAYGQVASSGVLIFLAGEKRLMTCSSHLHLHETTVSTTNGTGMTMYRLRDITKTMEANEESYVTTVSQVTKLPNEVVRRMMRDVTVLRPKEAVRLGFATGILGQCE